VTDSLHKDASNPYSIESLSKEVAMFYMRIGSKMLTWQRQQSSNPDTLFQDNQSSSRGFLQSLSSSNNLVSENEQNLLPDEVKTNEDFKDVLGIAIKRFLRGEEFTPSGVKDQVYRRFNEFADMSLEKYREAVETKSIQIPGLLALQELSIVTKKQRYLSSNRQFRAGGPTSEDSPKSPQR